MLPAIRRFGASNKTLRRCINPRISKTLALLALAKNITKLVFLSTNAYFQMKSFTESTAIKGSSIEKNINNAVRIDNYHNNFDQLH